MEFNFISIYAAAILVLLLIPNIIYAFKFKGKYNHCTNRLMNILEQVGRYGSFILMIVPLGVGEFGFSSAGGLIIYAFGSAAIMLAYWIVWAMYFHRVTAARAMLLAILPVVLFTLCAVTLRHWLLLAFTAVFAVGHIYITAVNSVRGEKEQV